MIHWELCKKFKFDHTKKWYMHNPESVLGNEMHTILRDFEIQTDHLISAERPDLMMAKKKKKRNCRIVNFGFSADLRVKLKESEIKDEYLDLARELKNCGT